MEEQDKYYVPKVEEFHVGFEYEIIYDDEIKVTVFDESDMMNVLRPTTTSTLGGIRWKLINNRIRVKYLDREDIESLGFEASPDEPDEWFWKFKGDINIQLYYDDKIRKSGDGVGITIYDTTNILFSGYIKNKSELKFILKSIGVLEENKI